MLQQQDGGLDPYFTQVQAITQTKKQMSTHLTYSAFHEKCQTKPKCFLLILLFQMLIGKEHGNGHGIGITVVKAEKKTSLSETRMDTQSLLDF